MAEYKPRAPFTTPLYLRTPETQSALGVRTKTFSAVADSALIYASFKTYGGTETTVDGVYSIRKTADVETWYRPDITSDCCISLAEDATGALYEIKGDVEDIDQRHQYMKFKVERVKGGA